MGSYQPLCRLPLARGSKRPLLVRWSSIAAGDDTITRVFQENPSCGVGLRLDQFVVVDCDSPERVDWWIEQGFPTDFMSRGNPTHRSFWYRLPDEVEMRARRFPDWEVKTGPGHHCVVPPSIHPGGWKYEWLGEPVDQHTFYEIPPAPVAFLESVQIQRERHGTDGAGWDVVVEGEGRDNFLASMGGFLHRWGMSEAAARAVLSSTNQLVCEPAMSPAAISRIARSTSRYEDVAPQYSFEVMDDEGTEVHPDPAGQPANGYRYSLVVDVSGGAGPPDPGGG